MHCCAASAHSDEQSDAMTIGPLTIDTARRLVFVDGERVELTKREFDLLAVLAENAGVVLTRQRLLELVWGYDFDVDTNVADVFISYLRRKLERDEHAAGDPHGSRDRIRAPRRAVKRAEELVAPLRFAAHPGGDRGRAGGGRRRRAVHRRHVGLLANNDAAQLDRRLDSIIDASVRGRNP